MSKIQVFDPAVCCSTGMCGPEVDPSLVTFAADLEWFNSQGTQVERINFAQQPQLFAQHDAIRKLPGQPITAHWGFADPAAVIGDRERQLKAFANAQFQIASRIRILLSLPMEKLDRMSLQARLRELGAAQRGQLTRSRFHVCSS